MLVLDCKKILKVGDKVVSNVNENVTLYKGGVIRGYIGEINTRYFYIWQNEYTGYRDKINPASKGYKRNWRGEYSNRIAVIHINEEPLINKETIHAFIKASIISGYVVEECASIFNSFYKTTIFTDVKISPSMYTKYNTIHNKLIRQITETYIKKID